MTSLEDRVIGAIVGLAVGDALGYPHEFRTVAQVRNEIGPQGITDFIADKDARFSKPFIAGNGHPPGTFTDDTQMSLCVAEALIAHGFDDDDALYGDMAARFVAWYFGDDNDRSPGAATGAACEKLKDGVSWRESGTKDSKGAGANMRVVPVGLFYEHLDDVERVARAQAAITHVHPAASSASAAVAIAAHMFVRGASPFAVVREIEERCGGDDASFDRLLVRLPRALARKADEVLVDVETSDVALGESWVAEEAVVGALWCVMRAPASYRDAVLLAVNTDGDSDTIACVAGGLMGARVGIAGVPETWARMVERSRELHEVGRRLFRAWPGRRSLPARGG